MNPLETIQHQKLEDLVKWTASEALRGRKPKYYNPDGHSDSTVFEYDRMIEDCSATFPAIPKDEIRRVVMQGFYNHYFR
jgi:hypothetical protein